MCTTLVNSKIFYIVMILFTVIGIMADCFNRSDIAMFLTVCTVIGVELAFTGVGFEILQVSDVLTGQEPDKIRKDKVKERR